MTKMNVVFLTLFAVSNLIHSGVADTRTCRGGRIQPVHPYFLETQDIVLECYSNKAAKNLSFKMGLKSQPVNEKLIEFRNDTYVKLVIPEITAETVKTYKRRRFVACFDLDTKRCIDNVFVKLEYYPKKVRDINCVMRDFKTLACDWKLGANYKFHRDVTVTSKFNFQLSTHFSSASPNWNPCPQGGANWTSCYLNERIISQFGTFFKIDVVVTVTNLKLNISVETFTSFKRDDIVKPSPVQGLTFNITQNPTCVLLLWENIVHRNHCHNITFQSVCDGVRTEQIPCFSMNCSYVVCGLNPYTNYRLSVISIFCMEGLGNRPWSQPAHLAFTSGKTVPKHSPKLTSGLYIYQSDAIILYWQPLDQCEKHSNDTVYEVEVHGVGDKEITPSSEFHINLPMVPTIGDQTEYTVTVVAKDGVGTAAEKSVIDVSSQKQVPIDSEMIVEYSRGDQWNTEYFVRIQMDSNNLEEYSNISHTVTWCRGDPLRRCWEPISWLENIEGTDVTRIPVSQIRGEYLFGLITKGYSRTRNRMVSTDIQFAQCIYEYNTVPQRPLPRVYLADVLLSHSVTVDWDGYKCQRSVTDLQNSVTYIENYIVTYCESHQPAANTTCQCIDSAIDLSVSKSSKRYTLTELPPGVGFCVWVAANNSAGRGPKNRNNLFHIVTDHERGTSVALLVICPIIVIVLVVGLLVFIKCCRSGMKAWLARLQGVHVPDITEPTTHMYVEPNRNDSIYRAEVIEDDTEMTTFYQCPIISTSDISVGDNSRTPLLGYNFTESIDSSGNIDSESVDRSRDIDQEAIDIVSLNSQLSDVRGCVVIEGKKSPIDEESDSFNDERIDDNVMYKGNINEINATTIRDNFVLPIQNTRSKEGTSLLFDHSHEDAIENKTNGHDIVFSHVPVRKTVFGEHKNSTFNSFIHELSDPHEQDESNSKLLKANIPSNETLDSLSGTCTKSSLKANEYTYAELCVYSEKGIDTNSDNESVDWNVGVLDGYKDVTQARLSTEYGSDGTEVVDDFEAMSGKKQATQSGMEVDSSEVDSSTLNHQSALCDTIWTPTREKHSNASRLSVGSEESNISAISDGHDSAIGLSGDSTDSCHQYRSPHHTNNLEERDLSSASSHQSIQTSDYAGSDSQTFKSNYVLSHPKEKGVRQADPANGYSIARLVDIS